MGCVGGENRGAFLSDCDMMFPSGKDVALPLPLKKDKRIFKEAGAKFQPLGS